MKDCANNQSTTRSRGKDITVTMKVPGQRLLQANEHTSDDDDHESDGDDIVVVGETWCSESEGRFSESAESDDSECELDHCRQRKVAALEVDGVPHALR